MSRLVTVPPNLIPIRSDSTTHSSEEQNWTELII